MLESGGFESRQRVLLPEPAVEPSEAGARWLGVTYWRAVDSFTRGGVRASWREEGGRLRLLGGATLLRFGPPELRYGTTPSRVATRSKAGCWRCERAARSRLRNAPKASSHEITVTVEEYLPRLAARAGAPWWTGALYAKGQSPFHAAVSRRYFQLLVQGRTA